MILFDEALNTVLSESIELETETVALSEALGRFLCEDITSPIDAPPFDKAAMDGYAVRPDDDRKVYRIRSVSAAGDRPEADELKRGEAVKIMTGAPLPSGAGKVIRVEFTRREGDHVHVENPEPYENIIKKGENIHAGDPLLTPRRLEAKDIGCLAAAGIPQVRVYRRLKIGIITTGDELRSPGTELEPGEIYDSNGPQLVSQIENAGALSLPYGVVPDDREAHKKAVERGLAECDILLLSGGVSKGDFDYVPETLENAGVRLIFHGVRVKPGRPTLFGRDDSTLVFGLPGNPVSVFVQFEVMVRPLIHRINMAPPPGCLLRGRLTTVLRRRDVDRAEFIPARSRLESEGLAFTPVRYGGSSHLNALANADVLVSIPAGTGRVEEGEWVDARLL